MKNQIAKMIKLEKYTPVILIFVSVLFILFYYGDVVLSPNSYLFSESGDGIKNYFTYAAHIKNDSSLVQSHLMNYPYGENFLYLDCHPLFTMSLKMLSVPFPSILNYSVGIINFLMIFSIVISAFFIYLLLVEFKVRKIFSAIGALAIALLAPQLFRVTGHLALSYSFFIPMSWYLYLRFSRDTTKIKWIILLFSNNLMWYFIHAYLGMIVVSFMLICFVVDAFVNKRKTIDHWMKISSVTILPLVLFWVVTIVTDYHIGRTNNPYGFLLFTSNAESVFLPTKAPFRPLLDQVMKIEQNWEGLAYIGIGSIVTILLLIGVETVKFSKRIIKKEPVKMIGNTQLIVAVFAAVILLLLSMGYPIKWKMEFLLDWFPVIKNFRGIGRFSWVFFYVATIGNIVYLNHLYLINKRKLPILIVGVLVIFSFFAEALPYHREVSKIINKSPNLFDAKQLPESYSNGLQYVEKGEYQAMISLPYFHIGSENYGKTATDKIYKLSMVISYHTGIPLMSNYSTRTSLLESKNLMQLFSPDFYVKEIGKDLKSKKPFLVLYSNEEISEREMQLLTKGKRLFSNSDYSLYSLPYNALFVNTSQQEVLSFEKIKNQLAEKNGFLTTSHDSTTVIIFDSYENQPRQISRSGSGAYKGAMKDYNVLEKINANVLKIDKEYVVSFWMYNDGENYGQDALSSTVFVETISQNDSIEWIATTNPVNGFMIDGAWSMVELTFKLTDENDRVSINLKGDDKSKKSFIIDDLLIREKECSVFKIEGETKGRIVELFKNNHRIIAK